MAAKYEVAVLLVTHLSKGGGARAMYRVMGSLAFVAAARAAWLVVRDKENPTRRLFLPVKNNLGNDQSGFAYSISGRCTTRTLWRTRTMFNLWKKHDDDDAPDAPRGVSVKLYPPNLTDDGIRLLSGTVEHVTTMSPKLGAWLVKMLAGEMTRRTEEARGNAAEADYLRLDTSGWTDEELAGAVVAARAFEQWGRRSKDLGAALLASELFGVILASAITKILGKKS